MSTYLEATFQPRAALPNEVTILIPNLMNFGETLPMNVPKDQLINIYMMLFGDNLFDQRNPFQAQAGADAQGLAISQAQALLSTTAPHIRQQWYEYEILILLI